MKSPEYSQARGPVGYAFLSRKELSLFRRLIDYRRSLPIYRAGRWLCYECPFTSTNLAAMARHIVRAHGAAPANRDDLEEEDSDSAGPAVRLFLPQAQNLSSPSHDDERPGKSVVLAGDERWSGPDSCVPPWAAVMRAVGKEKGVSGREWF